MRRLVVGLVLGALLAGGAPAAGQDTATCESRLLNVPLEDVTPPEGYTWDSLNPPVRGWWTGTIDLQSDGVDPTMYLTVGCAPDGAALLARIAEVESALGLSDKIAVVEIGDATIARRDKADPGSTLGPTVSIYFARGPFLAEVSSWDVTQGPMESVAQAIDAALVATP